MKNRRIYENIDEKNLQTLFNTLQSNTLFYKNNQIITYSIGDRNMIGIMEKGSANLVRFDYTGARTIVEELEEGDIFSDMFISSNSSELSVIATGDCQVSFFDYEELLKKVQTSQNALKLLNNLFYVLSDKLVRRNERIELLTTRSIRNKLLSYFELQAKNNHSKTFNLNYSYTNLADYLAIDRSAMMRELKNLKEDKLIEDVNKKITIYY